MRRIARDYCITIGIGLPVYIGIAGLLALLDELTVGAAAAIAILTAALSSLLASRL